MYSNQDNDKFFDKNNITDKSAFLTADKNELRRLKFYHGVQTKEDARNIMRKAEIGDFLIRSSLLKTKVSLILFLCVKVAEPDIIFHYRIEVHDRFDAATKILKRVYTFCYARKEMKLHDMKILSGNKEEESMDDERMVKKDYSGYEEMIKHYKTHRLPCGLRLGHALRRPSWQLRHSDIAFEESGKLGSGNFCVVYKGDYFKKSSKITAAIKVSKSTELNPAVLMETRNQLVAEAKIMINYSHVNVTKLHGLACDMPPIMVCLEYCCGGSLESLLLKHGKEMGEYERQVILIDAARGMRYLHTQKCVHRDLASRNCLIDHEGNVKIADFGLSKSLSSDQTAIKEALKEAPLVWMAPECIQKESEFSPKTDVWAYGVMVYEVYYNGTKPFNEEKNDMVIVKAIRKAKMPMLGDRTQTEGMQILLDMIWIRKPEERADFQKILEGLVIALVPHTPKDIDSFVMNSLPGVRRLHQPNVRIEFENVAQMLHQDFEYSDKYRKREKAEKSRNGQSKSAHHKKVSLGRAASKVNAMSPSDNSADSLKIDRTKRPLVPMSVRNSDEPQNTP